MNIFVSTKLATIVICKLETCRQNGLLQQCLVIFHSRLTGPNAIGLLAQITFHFLQLFLKMVAKLVSHFSCDAKLSCRLGEAGDLATTIKACDRHSDTKYQSRCDACSNLRQIGALRERLRKCLAPGSSVTKAHKVTPTNSSGVTYQPKHKIM